MNTTKEKKTKMEVIIKDVVYFQKWKQENVINCKLCDLSKSKYGNTDACHSVAKKHCSSVNIGAKKTMPYFKKKRVVNNNNNNNNQLSLF